MKLLLHLPLQGEQTAGFRDGGGALWRHTGRRWDSNEWGDSAETMLPAQEKGNQLS